MVLAAAAPALAESGSANNSGKLVDIGGGREMYMECQGKGYPTVVFVSGAEDRAETWSKTIDPSEQAVLPAIAETNRVCAYDRPGTILATGEGAEDFEPSRSDPVPQPTTLQDGVDDLHALLSARENAVPMSWSGIRWEARSQSSTRANTLKMSRGSSSSITTPYEAPTR